MKLFIDSANLDEIRTASGWGIIDGVTTNPTLAAKENQNFEDLIKHICRIVRGPVSAEVMALDAEKMVDEAQQMAKWNKNIVVKIPCTIEGLKAAKMLYKLGIPTNVTLVFSPNQALLAAKARATYISVFTGRLDDAGEDGLLAVAESVRIIENYKFQSRIIAASIRSPLTVQKAALLGAHALTAPFKILELLASHPLTDIGVRRFLEDWTRRPVV